MQSECSFAVCVCERGREGGGDGGAERVWELEGWKRRVKEKRERGKMEKKTRGGRKVKNR